MRLRPGDAKARLDVQIVILAVVTVIVGLSLCVGVQFQGVLVSGMESGDSGWARHLGVFAALLPWPVPARMFSRAARVNMSVCCCFFLRMAGGMAWRSLLVGVYDLGCSGKNHGGWGGLGDGLEGRAGCVDLLTIVVPGAIRVCVGFT